MNLRKSKFIIMMTFLLGGWSLGSAQSEFQTVSGGKLLTRWAAEVSPENVLQEYPRPQMVRKTWQNLNGMWDYSVLPLDSNEPVEWQGKLLVPFPVESALSGVSKSVSDTQTLWYHRDFNLPDRNRDQRWLLHLGAVDFDATIWVNGIQVANHKGGYDPFSIDISSALGGGNSQTIVIRVWDPTSSGSQPRGKQVNDPGGIWYNAVTGIWQTVWLEPVPQTYIRSLKITPDLDNSSVDVSADVNSEHSNYTLEVRVKRGWRTIAKGTGKTVNLKINDPRLWTPDTPYLYDLDIRLRNAEGKRVDRVQSYFGIKHLLNHKRKEKMAE